MRKIVMAGAGAIVGFTTLFVVAGRNLAELTGLVRASADKTVDDLTNQLPSEIHDRKLDHDLQQARQEVIDKQTQVNLSLNHLESLRREVRQLDESTQRRQALLAEAYPILKSAIQENKTEVRFASQDFALADFQREVDELLSSQDREERQLEIKRTGLKRLEKGARDGQDAVAEMHRGLDATEQEVAILRSRRQQAELEKTTFDMVSTVTDGKNSVAPVGASVGRLKEGVEKLEANNDARRNLAAPGQRPTTNQLTRGWTRLESLKAIHDKRTATDAAASGSNLTDGVTDSTAK